MDTFIPQNFPFHLDHQQQFLQYRDPGQAFHDPRRTSYTPNYSSDDYSSDTMHSSTSDIITSFPGGHASEDPAFGAQSDGAQNVRKRPKYTRSKAGCLTCRTKKIKCDEMKPICTRCSHGQRECTWPADIPRKKGSRKRRSSQSPEPSSSRDSHQSGRSSYHQRTSSSQDPHLLPIVNPLRTAYIDDFPDNNSHMHPDLNQGVHNGVTFNLDTSTLGQRRISPGSSSGRSYTESDDIAFGLSSELSRRIIDDAQSGSETGGNQFTRGRTGYGSGGSQSGSDEGRMSRVPLVPFGNPGYLRTSERRTQSLQPSNPATLPYLLQQGLQYPNPAAFSGSLYGPAPAGLPQRRVGDNNYDPGYPPVFMTSSANTSSHNSPLTRSPSPDHFPYSRTSSASPYSLPATTLNLNGADALNLSLNNVDATPRGPLGEWTTSYSGPQTVYQKSSISNQPTSMDMFPYSPSNHSSPDSNDDRSMATGGNLTTSGHGQWNHTPILMMAAPDPIEPFFRTLKERNLIRHYASHSTDLIMAVHTPASLNPVLASTLPIVLSMPPCQNASVEALRLSLLGVAAVHQAFLHSRSDPNRSYATSGALSLAIPSVPQSASAEKSTEMLQLGLVLRQNATQCLAHACQTVDGTWSDAALAASVSIALIDIFAGGHGYQSNLTLAKTLITIRGGPEAIIATNTPAKAKFGGGVKVSPARLLLEILAAYDAFGSLASGEEPTFLGGDDHPAWWFEGDQHSYHRLSVEKVFAMSRQSLFLVAKVSSLLSRARALEAFVHLSETRPSEASATSPAIALYDETQAILAELEEGSREGQTVQITEVTEADAEMAPPEVASDDRDAERASPSSNSMIQQRLEYGSQAHMMALRIAVLRYVYHVPRTDKRIQDLSEQILQRCLDSTKRMGMAVDLTWPVIIAGCQVEGMYRQTVPDIFEGFRKKCCFEIDTAEQIVTEVWRRVDAGLTRADWKSVLEDFDQKILIL